MSRREKVLYPVKVAAILVVASITVYVAFSAIPIVYSIYVAFTDASAKNVAPGPRLEELLKSRDHIVKHLSENRDLIVQASKEASLILEDALEALVGLEEYVEKATPETLSVVKVRGFKSDFDSKILKAKAVILSNETPLYLNPSIRDPLDRALRILDYRVWQALEASLLLKIVITESDIEVMRAEVIPPLDNSIGDLRIVYESLKSVESDYEVFVKASILELDRQIDELTLHFIGLDNFRRIFGDSRFPYSILKTLLFVFTSVPIKIFAGVMLAWVFSSELIYGRRVLRGLLLLPWAIPVLLSITTWRIFFTPGEGLASMYIEELTGYKLNIYGNEWHAFIIYNIVEMWLAYPFVMVVTAAAIASVPREILEASLVDGAKPLDVLTKMILPLIKRPVTFAAILTTGASLQAFMIPLLINNGGPAKILNIPGFTPATGYSNEMIVLYGYNRAWLDQEYGIASAAFLIVVSILLIYAILWYYFVYKKGPSHV